MTILSQYGVSSSDDNGDKRIIYSIALLYNTFNTKLGRFLDQYDLTPSGFNVLMLIKHQGGDKGLNQTDLTNKLIVNKSSITRLIDRLVEKKLVSRKQDVIDRRENKIKTTKLANKLLDDIWPEYTKEVTKYCQGLSKSDIQMLSELLEKLLITQ